MLEYNYSTGWFKNAGIFSFIKKIYATSTFSHGFEVVFSRRLQNYALSPILRQMFGDSKVIFVLYDISVYFKLPIEFTLIALSYYSFEVVKVKIHIRKINKKVFSLTSPFLIVILRRVPFSIICKSMWPAFM
jgi:hypothetical protein